MAKKDYIKTVRITLEFDPRKYEGGVASSLGAIDVARAMIVGDADFPKSLTIECGSDTLTVSRRRD